MNKNSITRKSTLSMTWDELYRSQSSWDDNFNMASYGNSSKKFEIGEKVKLGNLTNVYVVYQYGDGIYAVEFDSIKTREDIRNNIPNTRERGVVKWVEILGSLKSGDSTFTNDIWRRPNFINSAFDSFIHYFCTNGILMDTRFQRGYVWNDTDCEALLDTIFNHGVIGSFIFVRHAGYNFKFSVELEKYATISGDIIDIRKCDNNFISVIDGQQRITTLLNFYLNRFKYRGYYFNELSGKDHYTFLNTPVSYAIVDESEGYALKNWVWLFLQANKGVSQSREHLAKMEEYYKGL
jgi:hypothetical protein